MSSTARSVAIRLSTEGADKVRADFEAIGRDGPAALKRIETAGTAANPVLKNLAGVSDAAVQSLGRFGVAGGHFEAVAGSMTRGAGGITAGLTALAAAGVAAGVGIARAGDQLTGTMARLTAATGSVQTAERVYQSLFTLSQQTGVAVAEAADAFGRFAVAAKNIGATNTQVLALVGTLQKAGIVAGASTQETQSAVTQLGQALASGVLQGDELRSLLESMPQLASKLADQLGVSVGQLRQMGSEGQLTADRVLPALLKAGENINAEFEKMPPTMGRAFSVLGGAMENFAGQLDRALGLSQAIARAIERAAGVVRSVTSAVAPTDVESADAQIAAAQQRVNIAQIKMDEFNRLAAIPQDFGFDRTSKEQYAKKQADERAQLEDTLAQANGTLKEALEKRRQIQQAADDAEAKDRAAALAKKLASEREAALKGIEALREANDKKIGIEKQYSATVTKINEALASGVIGQTEADLGLAEALKTRTTALDGLAKSTKTVAAATQEAASSQQKYADLVARLNQDADKADAARAEKQAAEAKRQQDRIDAQVVRTTDNIVRYAGDSFADLFTSTGNGWAGLLRSLEQTAISTFARIAAEALLRPIVLPIVTSMFGGSATAAGGTASSGGFSLGSLGQLSGLSNLTGSGGLGGLGGSISSFLGSTAISGAGTSTSAALAGLSGYGPATLSQFNAAGGAGLLGGSGATFGSLLGGAGAGFAAGNLLNSLLGGNQLGGNIGSGLGAAAGAAIGSIIPGVGTLLGGLLGGGLGGGLGGLFGPGPKHHGYSWQVQGNGAGGLGFGERVFVDEIAQQQFAQEQQQMAAVNQFLQQNGISATGMFEVGGKNNNPNQVGSLDAGISSLRFSAANDNVLNTALDGRAIEGIQALQDLVTYVKNTYEPLLASGEAVSAFDAQIKGITDTFTAAIATAHDLGLAEDGLATARDEALAKATATRDAAAQTITDTLAARLLGDTGNAQGAALGNFDIQAAAQEQQLKDQIEALGLSGTQYAADRILEIEKALSLERLAIEQNYANASRATAQSLLTQLAFGSGSALAPEQQYFAAISTLNAAGQDLAAGGALSDYTSVASQVLPVARDFLGTSQKYGELVAQVASTVSTAGGDPAGLSALLQAQVNSTDGLSSVFAAYGDQSLSVQTATLSELKRLSSTIEALIARQQAA